MLGNTDGYRYSMKKVYSGIQVARTRVILHLFSSLFPARQNLAGPVFFV